MERGGTVVHGEDAGGATRRYALAGGGGEGGGGEGGGVGGGDKEGVGDKEGEEGDAQAVGPQGTRPVQRAERQGAGGMGACTAGRTPEGCREEREGGEGGSVGGSASQACGAYG